MNRRRFMQFFFYSAGTVSGLAALEGCKQKKKSSDDTFKDCNDLSGLTEDEKTARKKLGYRDQSPSKERSCSTCALFLPNPKDEHCGQCTLIKGPVFSAGTCIYWAPKNEQAG